MSHNKWAAAVTWRKKSKTPEPDTGQINDKNSNEKNLVRKKSSSDKSGSGEAIVKRKKTPSNSENWWHSSKDR